MTLRIAIVCGGGFSSSAMAHRVQMDAEKNGLTDRGNFRYIPSHELIKRQDEADIAMLCPHLVYQMDRFIPNLHIPLYIIPPKLYGTMPAEDMLEDAEDMYALWEQTHTNPVQFADEPQPLIIKRHSSHRRAPHRG